MSVETRPDGPSWSQPLAGDPVPGPQPLAGDPVLGPCKHVAALLCELIHKLNANGLLYLKLLGVDVYELAKSPPPSESKEEEEKLEEDPTPKRLKGSCEDPICL